MATAVASRNFVPEELFDTLLGGPNTDADNSVYKATMVLPSISNVSANGTTLSLSISRRKVSYSTKVGAS